MNTLLLPPVVHMPPLDPRFSRFTPRVGLKQDPFMGLPALAYQDQLALAHARRLERERATATGITGTFCEAFFTNRGDFTAHGNATAETSLIAGLNQQPVIPPSYFLGAGSAGRGFSVLARGILGTTSTPTIIFQLRLGATAGATFLSGTSIGVTAAITTQSGVSNKWWELRFDVICTVQGIGTGNATISGAGAVTSPGGFASPFIYALNPTTPDTATWTSTFDAAVTQYLNLSATWSAASASNTITCKQLIVTAFG